MINIRKDEICVVFDTEHTIGRLEEFQKEAFKAGFKWANGDVKPLNLGQLLTLHFNLYVSSEITYVPRADSKMGVELSVDFMMQKFKELQGSGGGDPEEVEEEVDEEFWEGLFDD